MVCSGGPVPSVQRLWCHLVAPIPTAWACRIVPCFVASSRAKFLLVLVSATCLVSAATQVAVGTRDATVDAVGTAAIKTGKLIDCGFGMAGLLILHANATRSAPGSTMDVWLAATLVCMPHSSAVGLCGAHLNAVTTQSLGPAMCRRRCGSCGRCCQHGSRGHGREGSGKGCLKHGGSSCHLCRQHSR